MNLRTMHAIVCIVALVACVGVMWLDERNRDGLLLCGCIAGSLVFNAVRLRVDAAIERHVARLRTWRDAA